MVWYTSLDLPAAERVAKQFVSRYPGITLDLGVTDRRVDLIADQVDVLLRTGALGDSSLLARKIRDEIRLVDRNNRLYLGKVWWGKTRLVDFALKFPDERSTA